MMKFGILSLTWLNTLSLTLYLAFCFLKPYKVQKPSSPAHTIARGQGSCCSFSLAKQNQASFCYASQIQWRWSLHMHWPRVKSCTERCHCYLLDGKLWLYYLNMPETCFTSLAPKGHRNCIQEHKKNAKQMYVMMTWCCLLPKAIWHN